MEDVFENFTASVTRAYKYISQIKKHESLTFGIKGIHVMSMIYLNKYKNGLTVSELAALCLEDKAAVSRNLDSLKDMGYVRFADSNAGKRRGRRAVLTPEGKKQAELEDLQTASGELGHRSIGGHAARLGIAHLAAL